MTDREFEFINKIMDEVHRLEGIKCTMEVMYYGMAHDTGGSDRYAVLSCAEVIADIHNRIKVCVEDFEGKEKKGKKGDE